jgi:thiamine pyrophosphate-dependent acetolactate synthase large subunit-like protein
MGRQRSNVFRLGSEVAALMELIDAAVVTTQSGRGIVNETDSRCISHFATFPALKDFVAKSDLLISIGVRFRGNETSNWSLTTPPNISASMPTREQSIAIIRIQSESSGMRRRSFNGWSR